MKAADLDLQCAKFPELKRTEVKKFVEWIRAQPHFANMDEGETIHFLYACNYSLELAKQVLDINLTVRTHCPEFFASLDCNRPEIQRAMRTVAIVPLPKSTPEGYRVIIGKLSDTNASNFNYSDIMKLYCMIFDMWLYEEGVQTGHIIVMDLKGCTLGHIARIGILQMKKFLYYLQEGAAIRLIGFHFVNIVPFMDKLMALMTPFLKKELTSVLFMHNTWEDFYKYVPREILPADYEGPEPSCDQLKEISYKKLIENRKEMMDFEERHKVNEKLRPGKPKNASDLFGIEGNFKKLDID